MEPSKSKESDLVRLLSELEFKWKIYKAQTNKNSRRRRVKRAAEITALENAAKKLMEIKELISIHPGYNELYSELMKDKFGITNDAELKDLSAPKLIEISDCVIEFFNKKKEISIEAPTEEPRKLSQWDLTHPWGHSGHPFG